MYQYVQHIADNAAAFSGDTWNLYAAAIDLGFILENKLFSIDLALAHNDRYKMKGLVEAREKVFDDYCTICSRVGIEIPPIEPELYKFYIPSSMGKTKQNSAAAKKHTFRQLRRNTSKAAKLCRAAMTVLAAFPNMSESFGGLTGKEVIAFVNDMLVTNNLEPIRDIRTTTHIPLPINETAHTDKLHVLIFDDTVSELIASAHALAGWPSLSVHGLHFKGSTVEEAVDQILERNADIVLMDEALGYECKFHGGDVLHELQKVCKATKKIFPFCLGNTGGEGDKLLKAGANGNFQKGRNVHPMREATRRIAERRLLAFTAMMLY